MTDRTIKFKAFHKTLKCWFTEIAIYADGMAGMSVDDFEKQLPKKYKFLGEEVVESDEESDFTYTMLTGDDWIYFEADSIELIQFTGLHDKHGKEIYESDVLNVGQDENFQVEYFNDTASWVLTGMETGKVRWIENREHCRGEGQINVSTSKIIGNIYEHPNLLQ